MILLNHHHWRESLSFYHVTLWRQWFTHCHYLPNFWHLSYLTHDHKSHLLRLPSLNTNNLSINRIKKDEIQGKKCHDKTMTRRKTCDDQRWTYNMCHLVREVREKYEGKVRGKEREEGGGRRSKMNIQHLSLRGEKREGDDENRWNEQVVWMTEEVIVYY